MAWDLSASHFPAFLPISLKKSEDFHPIWAKLVIFFCKNKDSKNLRNLII